MDLCLCLGGLILGLGLGGGLGVGYGLCLDLGIRHNSQWKDERNNCENMLKRSPMILGVILIILGVGLGLSIGLGLGGLGLNLYLHLGLAGICLGCSNSCIKW